MRSARPTSLETFLGGMETYARSFSERSACSTLKPSLVEWKHAIADRVCEKMLPLKPSLVEWKPGIPPLSILPERFLETFLGGMETCGRGPAEMDKHAALKPSLVEWKRLEPGSAVARR